MILYDIIEGAREILIDINPAAYRWSNAFFTRHFSNMIDIVYDQNISLFYDDLGDIEKGTYRYSEPWTASTAYALGDIVHNDDDEMFECTTAGTSSSTEPADWELGYTATTSDNTVVWTNLDRDDIPFPLSTKSSLIAYLVAKAYEIDATDQNNSQLSQTYMQQFGAIL